MEKYCSFKFEAKWLIDKEFSVLVKSVWSNFIRKSYAYKLAKKIFLLKQAIKSWFYEKIKNSNHNLLAMLQDLHNIQANLMSGPVNDNL